MNMNRMIHQQQWQIIHRLLCLAIVLQCSTIVILFCSDVANANHLAFSVTNNNQQLDEQQPPSPTSFITSPLLNNLNLNYKNSNLSSGHNQQGQIQTNPNAQSYNHSGNSLSSGSGLNNKDEQQQQIVQQNQFQSSISCGHLEFYVQLTFNKPFKGILYAYKMYQHMEEQQQQARFDHYYPLEIQDSCTIRGNGASIVYLELSFLSECVEKLPSYYSGTAPSQPNQYEENINGNQMNNQSEKTNHNQTISYTQSEFLNSHTFNLDGFHFRRALNENLPNQLNISKDDTYQLSLYVQNDPKIEQKYDSKVVVQCSPQVTKNIILEQNQQMNDYYRKVDQPPSSQTTTNAIHSPFVQRTIMPSANLTVTAYYEDDEQQQQHRRQQPTNEINVSNLIESRMDILRGRIPFLKLIDGNVELGDDVTLIIRSRQLDDYDSKISNCYAYDEKDSMRYQLTNQDGCPVDPTVMQAFKILHNVGSESKVYYTTFSAFKFPGSQYLNIQCTLLVCRQICPKFSNAAHQNHYKSARLTSEFISPPELVGGSSSPEAIIASTENTINTTTTQLINNSPFTTTSIIIDNDKINQTTITTTMKTIETTASQQSMDVLSSTIATPTAINQTFIVPPLSSLADSQSSPNGENRLRWVDFGRHQGYPPRLPNIPGIPSGFRNPLATQPPTSTTTSTTTTTTTTEASIESLFNHGHFGNFGNTMDDEMYIPSMNIRRFNITRVEHIVAECSDEYMKVVVRFNGTFNGLIYSSGYVHDPNCIYVNGSGSSHYEFFIRLNQCGTLGRQEMYHPSMPGEARRRDQLMWNTLSIQYNPLIEEEFDEHFRLTCEYGSDFWKTVTFPSVNVEINTGSPVVFTINPPQCQMEIRRGFGIAGTRTTGPVTVGDPLTLLIHMKSDKVGFDILVKNCIAHNGAQQRMQLIDSNGCVTNDKLISPFRGTYNGENGHQVSLFAYLKAFRFTGSLALYLECDIHMCHNRCPPQRCYWRNLSKRSAELQSYGESLNSTGKPILSESISLFQALEVHHDQDEETPESSRAEHLNGEQVCLGNAGLVIMGTLLISLMTLSLATSLCYCNRMRKLKYIQRGILHQHFNDELFNKRTAISYPSTNPSNHSSIRSTSATNFSDTNSFHQAYRSRFSRFY